MTIQDIVGLLKEGGPISIAALFIWLYLDERKAHKQTEKDRISDLKISMESVHKSVNLLEDARNEWHRRGG